MNVVDVLIIVAVVLTAWRGYRIGFFRQALSLGGFILGLFVATWAIDRLTPRLPSGSLQPLIITFVTLVIALLLAGGVETLGLYASRGISWPSLDAPNRWAGLVFGGLAALFGAWLVGVMLSHSTNVVLSQPVQRSWIIQQLDQVLSPNTAVFADVEGLLNRNGFPEVFAGLEPASGTRVSAPSSETVRLAVAAAAASTVKVQGIACNEEVIGSGFVAAPDLVVTNAHVVAGEASPIVVDAIGSHPATVVYFDPNLDLALLRVPDLHDSVLTVANGPEPIGTTGAVLGYPGGGLQVTGPAAIITQLTAIGRNIYGHGLITRSIYELQADIEPGSSGGPMVLPDGQVVAMVFARSTATTDTGYALTGSVVAQDIAKYGHNTAAVSTGACVQ